MGLYAVQLSKVSLHGSHEAGQPPLNIIKKWSKTGSLPKTVENCHILTPCGGLFRENAKSNPFAFISETSKCTQRKEREFLGLGGSDYEKITRTQEKYQACLQKAF